ncbi:hypothetical protein KC345_g11797, partial [Hortaea werneckii]
VKPVPFCVLDEVEAALDEANVVRFAQYLREFSEQTQFIVVTHRKGTMEEADVLYGVTMEEGGVSKLVSFRDGLEKTRKGFVEKVSDLIIRRKKIDEEFYEELEEILIGADVGVNTVMTLVEELRAEVKQKRIEDAAELQPILSRKLMELLRGDDDNSLKENPDGITVILFVGVNGVGKTTTIGKLAHRYKQEGKKVLLAAGDTFRAGAIEQLEVWGQRAGVDVIKQQSGSDPAAVMFDAVQAAKQRNVDVLICDTAGRLQNKSNLMDELNKI